jgi:hypothetical protein
MFVWYYKINNEARRYLKDESINPGVSVLAITLGVVLLYIPPLMSVFRSGKRVRAMQERAGGPGTTSPGITLLLLFVLSLWVVYLQSALNTVWDQASGPERPAVPPPTAP